MSKSFNCLTVAQIERLALLAEEAAEVVKAAMKILRHGYESCHPHEDETNRESLERECGDLLYAINLIAKAKDLRYSSIEEHQKIKENSVFDYLHHQRKKST